MDFRGWTLVLAATVTLASVANLIVSISRRRQERPLNGLSGASYLARIVSVALILATAGAVLTVILATYGGTEARRPNVQIVMPQNGAAIFESVEVAGTYSNLPSGSELWVFVRVPAVSIFYPGRSNPCVVSPEGIWDCGRIFVGGATDEHGDEYQILVAIVDERAQFTLRHLLREEKTSVIVGLSTLPVGATVLDSVRVVRAES